MQGLVWYHTNFLVSVKKKKSPLDFDMDSIKSRSLWVA